MRAPCSRKFLLVAWSRNAQNVRTGNAVQEASVGRHPGTPRFRCAGSQKVLQRCRARLPRQAKTTYQFCRRRAMVVISPAASACASFERVQLAAAGTHCFHASAMAKTDGPAREMSRQVWHVTAGCVSPVLPWKYAARPSVPISSFSVVLQKLPHSVGVLEDAKVRKLVRQRLPEPGCLQVRTPCYNPVRNRKVRAVTVSLLSSSWVGPVGRAFVCRSGFKCLEGGFLSVGAVPEGRARPTFLGKGGPARITKHSSQR